MQRPGEDESEVIAKRVNDPCVVSNDKELLVAYEITDVREQRLRPSRPIGGSWPKNLRW